MWDRCKPLTCLCVTTILWNAKNLQVQLLDVNLELQNYTQDPVFWTIKFCCCTVRRNIKER